MQSISGIIYLILGACLLPYAFTFIAKKAAGFKSSDNQHPREVLAKSTGLASRANAVQQNSFESLPLFIAAILMAEYMVIQQQFIMTFGIAYLVLRVIYGSTPPPLKPFKCLCSLYSWSVLSFHFMLRIIVWD